MADVSADATLNLTLEAQDASSDVIDGVSNALDGMQVAIGAVGIATGIAFLEGAEHLQAYGLQIQRISFMTNESAADSSRLVAGFVGQGLSADQATGMIQRLEMRLGTMTRQQDLAAAAGRKSTTVLDELGIHTRDAAGHTRSMSDILPEIIDRLHGMTDANERARIGQQLFGRNWSQLAPLIEAGGAAFTKAGLDADKFGLVLSEKDVAAAHAAEVAHAHLTEAVQGFGNMLGTQVMPWITRFNDFLADTIARIQTINPATLQTILHFAGLAAIIGTLVGGLSAVAEVLKVLTVVLGPAAQQAIQKLMLSMGAFLGPIFLVAAAALILYEAYNRVAWVHQMLHPLVVFLTGVLNAAEATWNRTHNATATFRTALEGLGVPLVVINGLIGAATALIQHWQGILIGVGAVIGFITAVIILNNTILAVRRALVAADIAISAIHAVIMGEVTAAEVAMAAGGWLAAAAELAMLWPIALIVLGIIALIVVIVLIVQHWKQVHEVLTNLWTMMTAFGNWVVGFFVGMWTTLTNTITTFFTGIVTTAIAGWTEFARHPAYWIGYIVGYIPVKLTELQKSFVGWIGEMIVNVVNWSGHMVTEGVTMAIQFGIQIGNQIGQLPGQIFSWLMNVIPQIGAWAANMVQSAIVAAIQFGEALRGELNKLPDQMYSIGRNIVQGVINGIISMIGAGIGAIGSLVHGLIQGAHDAGQGGSPYMLFAPVGHGIVQGVALGIRQATETAQIAMANAITGLAGVAAPAGAAAGSAAGAAIGAGAGGPMLTPTAAGAGAVPQSLTVLLHLDGKVISRAVFEHGADRWRLMGGALGGTA